MARNGYAQDFDLVEVFDGHRLVREAADQLRAALAALWLETGDRPKISEAFRSIQTQEHYARTMPAGTFARPGTSNHGLGRAADVGGGVASYDNPQHWIFDRIARQYGFNNDQGAATKSRTNPRGEAWHYVYVGNPPIRATGREWNDVTNLVQDVQAILQKQGWMGEQADLEDLQSNNIEDKINRVLDQQAAIGATLSYLFQKAQWHGEQDDRAERKVDALLAKAGITLESIHESPAAPFRPADEA